MKPLWDECRVLPSCINPVPDMQKDTQRHCWGLLPTLEYDIRLQGRDRYGIKRFCSPALFSICTCLSSLLAPPSVAFRKPLPHSPFLLISSPSLPTPAMHSQPRISSTEGGQVPEEEKDLLAEEGEQKGPWPQMSANLSNGF